MSFLEDTKRSIWHAYTALARGEGREVAKSSLKVLTNNIGHAWGNSNAEAAIDGGNTDTLAFPDYFQLIASKVLFPSNSETALVPGIRDQIDRICWMLCEAQYLRSCSSLNTHNLFQLWKVFNFLAKVDLDSTGPKLMMAALPLRVDVEEARRIGSLIRQAVGFDALDPHLVDPSSEDQGDVYGVDFVQFVSEVIDSVKDLADDVKKEGIGFVCREILNDIIKMGHMEKFGNQITAWKRRWFRLSSRELQYFMSEAEQEKKGTIDICRSFKAESVAQRGNKPFCIKVHTPIKTYELAVNSLRCKNEWLLALKKAAENVGKDGSFQKSELLTRERARRNRREKVAEELFGKSKMLKEMESCHKQLELELLERQKDKSLMEKKDQELEAERLARLETEARLALEAEQWKQTQAELERLLEQEKQAKRDEEIVRGLQSRLLLEETEKREQLEKLQKKQEKRLQEEREEREGLEQQCQLQQERLNATQLQLDGLSEERQRAEQKVRDAEEKTRLLEVERHKMEERLRLRDMSSSVSMRRPKAIPDPDPLVTHRGKGAFVAAEFVKKNGNETRDSGDEDTQEDREVSHPKSVSEDGASLISD